MCDLCIIMNCNRSYLNNCEYLQHIFCMALSLYSAPSSFHDSHIKKTIWLRFRHRSRQTKKTATQDKTKKNKLNPNIHSLATLWGTGVTPMSELVNIGNWILECLHTYLKLIAKCKIRLRQRGAGMHDCLKVLNLHAAISPLLLPRG